MKLLFSINNNLLERDLLEVFRQLGFNIKILDYGRNHKTFSYKEILKEIERFAPDFHFSVNFTGFDKEGVIFNFFEKNKIPVLSWELDQPYWHNLAGLSTKRESPLLHQFIWDEGYVGEVKKLGFSNVYYLPLGCSPFLAENSPEISEEVKYQLVFVGSSLAEFYYKLKNELIGKDFFTDKKIERIYQETFSEHLENTEFPAIELLRSRKPFYSELLTDEEEIRKFEFVSEIRMSLDYRTIFLQNLPEVVVFGDSGWRNYIGPQRYMGTIDYYRDLKELYRNSAFVLNLTLVKNRLDANQRIFDVFGAGGFLVSDRRKNLISFFNKDFPLFRTTEDLYKLIDLDFADFKDRKTLIQKYNELILKKHLLLHRVEEMFRIIVRE